MKAINLEYLKQLMAENAMDVKQLAKAANINLRSAKGILDGSVSRPTKSTVTRLADAFGVSAESLVFEVVAPARERGLKFYFSVEHLAASRSLPRGSVD